MATRTRSANAVIGDVKEESQSKATQKRSANAGKASKSANVKSAVGKSTPKKTVSTKRKPAVEKLDPWRPTKYREEYCQQILDYFTIEVSREEEVIVKPGVTERRRTVNTFPTITRFAASIRVSRDTLYEWASKKDENGVLVHPRFSDALLRAQEMQETLMIEGGLSGAYEPKVLVFIAPNLTRLKNKIETTADVSMNVTSTEKLDEIYANKMEQIKAGAANAVGRAERLGLMQK